MPKGKLPQPPATQAKMLELLAQGLSQAKVGKACGVSRSTVKRVLAIQGNQDRLNLLRAEVRELALDGVKAVLPPAVKWAENVATAAVDAKAFDQLTRGLANLERVGASCGPQEPKEPVTAIQVVVAPGWSKAGDWAGMATVQAQATVVEVKPWSKPAVEVKETPETAKMKAMHQAGELD